MAFAPYNPGGLGYLFQNLAFLFLWRMAEQANGPPWLRKYFSYYSRQTILKIVTAEKIAVR